MIIPKGFYGNELIFFKILPVKQGYFLQVVVIVIRFINR